MHFHTLLAATIALASTATAMAVERPKTRVTRDAILDRFNIEKRACDWGSCENCYEKYSYCHRDDPWSTINWYVEYFLKVLLPLY